MTTDARHCHHCGQDSPGWIMNSDGSGVCPSCFRLCLPTECPAVPQKSQPNCEVVDQIKEMFGILRHPPKRNQ